MTDKPANKMWGGRFAASPAEIMEEINASIGFDKASGPAGHPRLEGARGHAGRRRASSRKDDARGDHHAASTRSLAEIEGGKFAFSRALEDVHMNVESRLKELIGAPAGRLHTARSRNDQVATDFRLYVRDRIDALDAALAALQLRARRARPRRMPATVMPGFTHLQPAQPVTFGHHLLAYVEMLARDRGRLRRRARAAQRVPARRGGARRHLVPDRPARDGRGARLRPADRQLARRRLRPRLRAGDAGRRRRSAAVHLSRFAEEIVIWIDAAVRLHPAVRQVHHRLLDHAAEAQSRRGRAGRAPRSGASPAPSRACSSS